jgi:hypothetical protein
LGGFLQAGDYTFAQHNERKKNLQVLGVCKIRGLLALEPNWTAADFRPDQNSSGTHALKRYLADFWRITELCTVQRSLRRI